MYLFYKNEDDNSIEIRWTWLPWWLGNDDRKIDETTEEFRAWYSAADGESADKRQLHDKLAELIVENMCKALTETQRESVEALLRGMKDMKGFENH